MALTPTSSANVSPRRGLAPNGQAPDAAAAQQQQADFEALQGFVSNGGLAQALQNNPQGAQVLRKMLSQTAQNQSRDQAQLQGLANNFGLGNSPTARGQAQAQAFNPLVPNNLSQFGRLGTGDPQLDMLGQLGGGGGFFEDKVFALMTKVVEDFQKQIEERLNNLQSQATAAQGAAAAGGQDTGGESRNIEFEKIKYDMQKLSQMQQAMSNILNTQDELAKNAIHHIKGG